MKTVDDGNTLGTEIQGAYLDFPMN
jgi:hypothetical protein